MQQPRLNSTLPNYNRITECLVVDYEYRTVSDKRTEEDVHCRSLWKEGDTP